MKVRYLLFAAAAFLLYLSVSSGQDAVSLRMIVVPTSAEADRVQQQLKGGADFAVLAREKSTDATAVDGGLMTSVDPASLRGELRTAIQGLQPGGMSATVKIPTGYAILKLLPASEVAGLAETERARQFAASAESSVRFTFDISGLNEAEAALANYPKPEGWNLNLATACEMRKQSLAAMVARADKLIADTAAAPPADAMSARVARGQLHAYLGEMGPAIEQFELAYTRAKTDLPRALPYLDELLGIAYLHKSEMTNGVYRTPGERCLFPIAPSAKYANAADSQKAVQHFLAFLKDRPDDLEVKWLLTIANMTLGVPSTAFTSTDDVGRFRDVAPAAGLNLFSMAAGIIVDDFDNDGHLDVVTSSFDMCAPMHFFHGKGDGTFEDRSEKSKLTSQLGGLNMVQADYNNDGCTDILVLRGGWEVPQRKSLLRNNCNGTFTDVTHEAGLDTPTATQTAVWLDINNDGLLDLYVGNEGSPNQLFLNKGDGTFKDISRGSGTDISAMTKGVTAADFDRDGFMDIYVSNYRGYNSLFHNNGDGTFTDIAKQAGVPGTGHGFPAWFFDYDNDGWPDLFVSSYFMSTDETARSYLGLPHNAGTLKLYRNRGNGTFQDVTKDAGLDKVFMPMGSNFGDIDNDGYPDIYLGTGDPTYASLVPNVLLHNREGKAFTDVTFSSGTGELHKGHGVAFADILGHGDEDILTVIGGAVPGDSHAFRLFRNPGHGNDWITLKLTGVKTNRSAIGAVIKVTVRNEGRAPRTIYRTVNSGGSFGASPLQQHIGLGKAAEIQSIEIQWPGGGVQTVHAPKNQLTEVKEGARYPVTGIVLGVDPARKSFTASIAAVPGYMEAMSMPFKVHDTKLLQDLRPGAHVEFTLVVDTDDSWAEGIRPHEFVSFEQEPLLARRLQLLQGTADAAKPLQPGQAVPDFTLTDQTGHPVTLSQFAGKVVAVTFIYTSCPLPNYCFRLSNNFGRINQRFADRMGRDIVLLSITFDPVHDTPAVLTKYSATWKADPKSWRFLTGSLPEVQKVCRLFGLNFWQDEGLVTHSLHTLVIDRQGRLAADFEGNEFTAQQLGDFIQSR